MFAWNLVLFSYCSFFNSQKLIGVRVEPVKPLLTLDVADEVVNSFYQKTCLVFSRLSIEFQRLRFRLA